MKAAGAGVTVGNMLYRTNLVATRKCQEVSQVRRSRTRYRRLQLVSPHTLRITLLLLLHVAASSTATTRVPR